MVSSGLQASFMLLRWNSEEAHTHTYTLEKPQRAVEPYGPYWNLLANLVTFLYLPTFALFIFLLMICLLDNPAVHSSTQELSAGTFTAPVTGLFVGHPPVTRGMAPCCYF